MYKNLLLFSVLAVVPALATTAQVNTDPTWNGSSTINSFGYPNTATYAEAITTPSWALGLVDFSFWLQESPGFEFQAFVSPWDNVNTELTGSVLYTSPTLTAVDGSLDEYTVNVGTIPLVPGTIYLYGLTIDNVYGADSASGAGGLGGDIFANGSSTYYFGWNNDSGTFATLYSNWNDSGCAGNTGSCGSGEFLADFETPEPGSLMLLGSGMLLLAGLARRKARI